MFEQLQFSGLLLCYGPLTLVIVGFIAFAIITDKNARGTYLRRLDPRADADRAGFESVVVEREVVVRTPSGMKVKMVPGEEPAPPPAPSGPDDLQKIEGIGPKMNRVLQAAGITTFAALAAKTADELRTVLTAGDVNVAINNPETWPEQAKLAAEGAWDALQALQDRLTGGRR